MNDDVVHNLKMTAVNLAVKNIPFYDTDKDKCINDRLNESYDILIELIVRECADLFEVEWGDEKLTGNDVGYVVKKHFGVEE